MPQAIKVTDENLERIVEYADSYLLNTTYLHDIHDYAVEHDAVVYVIKDGKAEWNNICFTTMFSSDFNRIWKFKDDETGTTFQEIEKL